MSIISPNYMGLTCAQYVHELLKPLLSHTEISVLYYCRVYDDGYFYFLTSHRELSYNHFKHEYPVICPIPTKLKNKKSFIHIEMPTGTYKEVLHIGRQKFNIGNTINFIERHVGYYDNFTIGGSADRPELLNDYINMQETLKNFFNYFLKQANQLIRQIENNKIILLDHMRVDLAGLEYCQDKIHPLSSFFEQLKKQRFIYVYDRFIKVSIREIDCMRLCMLGYTAKETSVKLGLSPRTVENYLYRLKEKVGCKNMMALCDTVWQIASMTPLN